MILITQGMGIQIHATQRPPNTDCDENKDNQMISLRPDSPVLDRHPVCTKSQFHQMVLGYLHLHQHRNRHPSILNSFKNQECVTMILSHFIDAAPSMKRICWQWVTDNSTCCCAKVFPAYNNKVAPSRP
jgi:hypothetical protein